MKLTTHDGFEGIERIGLRAAAEDDDELNSGGYEGSGGFDDDEEEIVVAMTSDDDDLDATEDDAEELIGHDAHAEEAVIAGSAPGMAHGYTPP
ncbi:MAG TPA: hypothetical protein VGU23_09235, partial [Acidobacteriaceae bacterium]|nr:hypothetical protein [Acidobacteriaceae bacterium]